MKAPLDSGYLSSVAVGIVEIGRTLTRHEVPPCNGAEIGMICSDAAVNDGGVGRRSAASIVPSGRHSHTGQIPLLQVERVVGDKVDFSDGYSLCVTSGLRLRASRVASTDRPFEVRYWK